MVNRQQLLSALTKACLAALTFWQTLAALSQSLLYATAAQTLRALPTNTPTSEIEAQRAAYQNSLDYQPRTEIGRNATESALGLLGGALQGPMAAGKAIAEPLTPIYDAAAEQYKRLPRRVQLGAESLLDLF